MLVTELMPVIRELSREEKLQLMEFIQSELEQEDIMPFQPGVSYPVWSPSEAHEAAHILSKMLAEHHQAKDA
ncbi:MAG: hypothetical protein AB4352_17360 [Hormoscilla sp.]